MPGSLTAPAAHPAHWLMVSFFIHKVRLYEREIEDRLRSDEDDLSDA